MTYVIAEPCINTKDTACVEVCPVDCIHPKKDEAAVEKENKLYIDPETCKVERGKTVENADCFVKTSKELFVKMYNGHHVPGMSDFMSGRIKSNNPFAMKTFVEAFSG